ncbi:hypothetical protein [Photobacterium atrarenae]|uniref:Uncharacterized protein n=1 Tax=Photobacterium atrarenae TaxID=865757 RepID=A0ABY5GG50_9GAMM|nr:hypothetical protein [Photobacterium atrarenae]UTV27684.1 hypothetical protein NNL38_15600 [Photobacterium atrarenae]
MAKSLCKYRRAEIGDQFAQISRIVSEPKFVCRSCARSASEKGYLCKPSSIQLPKPSTPAPKAGLSTSAAVASVPAAAPVVALQPALDGAESGLALPASLGKKQRKKLKKLAKKKNKRLKKAAKAVKRYEKALHKAKRSMKLA